MDGPTANNKPPAESIDNLLPAENNTEDMEILKKTVEDKSIIKSESFIEGL